MDTSRLEGQFPNLALTGFVKTSPATVDYNCIAHAAGKKDRWWWPSTNPPYYWPPNVPRVVTLLAFVEAFKTLGYEECANGHLEVGIEKIAIYILNGNPTHAARQLPSGKWTSKLGANVDIEHALAGLDGPTYGLPTKFMKRPRLAKKKGK